MAMVRKRHFLHLLLTLVITLTSAFTLRIISDNEDSLSDFLYDNDTIFCYKDMLESVFSRGRLFLNHSQEPVNAQLIISYLERQEKSPPA